MNAFVDYEELVICPYDKNHSIMKSKLSFHLVKCRKNHSGAAMAVCDYNQEHRVPKPELKYHHETCADRLPEAARSRALHDENVMSFPIVSDILTPAAQSWNDDLDHPGYDSESIIDKNNILRSIAVEKPSTKKQFRVEEQRRMNALRAPSGASSGQGDSSSSCASSSVYGQFVDEDKPEYSLVERLRRGDKTVYEPTSPEELEWTTKSKRKSKK